MDMQNVSNLQIPEGAVRTIHDKDNNLLWGRLNYNIEYAGNIFQQTYDGKNLLNLPDTVHYENQIKWTVSNSIHAVGQGTTASNAGSYLNTATAITFDITGNFTFSISQAITAPLYIRFYSSSNANLGQIAISTGNTSKTGTIPSGAVSYRILLAPSPNTTYNIDIYLQFEKGSQPSAIEPYVGGVASPNPDYPQDIQVVNGTQTVTLSDGVNNHDYIVNLGITELCKIGAYRDYIYKSGNDWYVHKEIGKSVLDGSEAWVQHSYVINNINGFRLNVGAANSDGGVFANYFRPVTWMSYQASGANGRTYGTITTADPDSSANVNIYITQPDSSVSTLAQFQTWLSTHNTTAYYAIATPTDTKITDATLISQLNAIHQWLTRYGYNATVTGNLPMIIDKTNL